MIYFFAAIGVMTCITIVGALILLLMTTGEDGVAKSIMYDDPEYFIHEPKWLNDDKKADMQQEGKRK
ncbi:hypothetical protein J6S88_03360 [bacterium]|nr:hypothetical protein [bacterium]